MEVSIGQVIKNLRKAKGISQESLADEMGISVQAVSKWETQNSFPDIILIPQIAKYFGISIDYLFFECEHVSLDFDNKIPDDGVLRIVQFKGKKLLSQDTYDSNRRIKLLIDKDDYEGDNKPTIHIDVWGSADIQGCISGGLSAGDGVNCGNISGGVNAGDGINCGDIDGAVQSCGGDIHCKKITGDVACEGDIFYQ